MLKESLYLYAMLLFCFTALEDVEKCPETQDISITKGKCSLSLDYLTNEEASAMYALLEDDNGELDDEFTVQQFFTCKQDENNPKEASKRAYSATYNEKKEEYSLFSLA